MAEHNYIFPNVLANFMSKLSTQVQYEATMMSTTMICIGLMVSAAYFWIYTNFELWYKIFIVINAIAGLILLSSSLITTYQQYLTYMKALDFQKQMKGGEVNAEENNLRRA